MGVPSQIDVCDYFIHNHKNVQDVKFVYFNEENGHTVVVKFNDKQSADRFLELDYVMFFGKELGRNVVNNYLKSKSAKQKDDFSMMLLGKKYIWGTPVEGTQGTKRHGDLLPKKERKKIKKQGGLKFTY